MIHKSVVAGLLLTLFLIVGPGLAFSQITPKSYMGLKGGYYSPTGDFGGDKLSGSPYWELAGGFSWGIFAVEIGAGYLETENSRIDIKTVPILLSGKLRIPIFFVVPYVRGGIGTYYTDVQFKSGEASGGTWSTGYHGGLGIDFQLGPVLLGIEGTYMAVKPSVNGRTITLDGATVTANVGFRF
jgi:hypothetical protein